MKRLILLLFSTMACAQTFTVSGHVVNPNTGAPTGMTITFSLINTGTQQCKVSGTGLIVPNNQVFTPDLNGVISGTLYRNDFITCGTSTNTQWQYQILGPGVTMPKCALAAVTTTSLNVDSAACTNTVPTVTPPTGDTTYCRLDGSNCGFTGSVTLNSHNLTGIASSTIANLDGMILLDGTKYALTVAGLQSALSDCNASTTCSGVDARQLGSVSGTTTTTVPAYRSLIIGPNTVIAGTSDPVVCFNSGSAIIGPYVGEGTNGGVGTIKSTAAASRVLAPCTANPRTVYVYFMGLDLWNSSGSATAAVLDMTGVNHGRLDNNFIQHSGGTGDLVFITTASGGDAFYNLFVGEKIVGATTGAGYHITNGANSQVIVGGKIDNPADCLLVDSTGTQTNEITVLGTACESQTSAVIHTIGNTTGVRWFGGRWESPSPATLFNISASSSQIEVVGVGEYNTQTCGTTNSLVTIIGWPLGSPCAPASTDIASANDISAAAFNTLNSGITSLFVNTANANNPLNVSVDGNANGNGLGLLDSHAGGHSFLFTPGAFNLTHLSIRDTTQSGQPAWGFHMGGTFAGEALLDQSITANRTYTFPDATGQVPITPNLTTSATAPTIAAAGCGGSAAAMVATNGTSAFEVNVGSAPTSAGCTVTMPSATTGWNCDCSDLTTTSTSVFYCKQTGAVSQTSVVLQNFSDVAAATAFSASDHLRVKCNAY